MGFVCGLDWGWCTKVKPQSVQKGRKGQETKRCLLLSYIDGTCSWVSACNFWINVQFHLVLVMPTSCIDANMNYYNRNWKSGPNFIEIPWSIHAIKETLKFMKWIRKKLEHESKWFLDWDDFANHGVGNESNMRGWLLRNIRGCWA